MKIGDLKIDNRNRNNGWKAVTACVATLAECLSLLIPKDLGRLRIQP